MSQFEQENDLGRGGGEVDDETMADAWQNAAERRSTRNVEGEESGVVGPGLGVTADDASAERMMDDEDAGMGGLTELPGEEAADGS